MLRTWYLFGFSDFLELFFGEASSLDGVPAEGVRAEGLLAEGVPAEGVQTDGSEIEEISTTWRLPRSELRRWDGSWLRLGSKVLRSGSRLLRLLAPEPACPVSVGGKVN